MDIKKGSSLQGKSEKPLIKPNTGAMTGNRRGTQAKRRQEQVAPTTRRVEQSGVGTSSSSNNEEEGEDKNNGRESDGGDAGGIPRTVFGEGAGEFERGEEHTEDGEGSSTTGTSTIVTTSIGYDRHAQSNHKRTIAQQVREVVFYRMPFVQHNEEKCGFGSLFQKVVCRLSSVDGKVEQELWNKMGKREARKGLSDKRKTVTSAMQKEFKSKWQLIRAK
jgi:hypothetical protein